MKKAIKGLIVASAVAAVVGVGAVSYAAWSTNNSSSATVSGSAGTIVTVTGDAVLTPATGTGAWDADTKTVTMTKKLFPNDQTSGVSGDGVTIWEFTITPPTTTGTANITYKLGATLTANGNATTGAALHWSGATVTGKTTADTDNVLGTTPVEITPVSNVFYVYMTADNTAAMGATIALSFEAVASESST